MKYIWPILLLACGCLSDAAFVPSRPVEYIDLSPTPAAKETKPPAGAPSQPVVVNLYSADWCIYCKAHDEYWKAREWKGNGFTVKRVTEIPDWLNEIPAYHWNAKNGSVFVHCEPKQLQESFDLSK